MPLDQEDLEMFATALGGIQRAIALIATRLEEGNRRLEEGNRHLDRIETHLYLVASNLDEVIDDQRAAIRIFRDD